MIKQSQIKLYCLAVLFVLNQWLDLCACESASGLGSFRPVAAPSGRDIGRTTPHSQCISPTTASVLEEMGRCTPPDFMTRFVGPAIFPSQPPKTPRKPSHRKESIGFYQKRVQNLIDVAKDSKLTKCTFYELGQELIEGYQIQKHERMEIKQGIFFIEAFKDYLMLLFQDKDATSECLSLWHKVTEAYCDLLQYSWMFILDKSQLDQVTEFQNLLVQPAALIALTVDVKSKPLDMKALYLKQIFIVIYQILEESLERYANREVQEGFMEPWKILLYTQ